MTHEILETPPIDVAINDQDANVIETLIYSFEEITPHGLDKKAFMQAFTDDDGATHSFTLLKDIDPDSNKLTIREFHKSPNMQRPSGREIILGMNPYIATSKLITSDEDVLSNSNLELDPKIALTHALEVFGELYRRLNPNAPEPDNLYPKPLQKIFPHA